MVQCIESEPGSLLATGCLSQAQLDQYNKDGELSDPGCTVMDSVNHRARWSTVACSVFHRACCQKRHSAAPEQPCVWCFAAGFLAIPGFATREECAAMMQRANELVAGFDPATRSIFSTADDNKVRCQHAHNAEGQARHVHLPIMAQTPHCNIRLPYNRHNHAAVAFQHVCLPTCLAVVSWDRPDMLQPCCMHGTAKVRWSML